MTTDSRNADLIARAIAANAHLGEALAELIRLTEAIRDTFLTPVQTPFERPSNAPQTRDEALAAHRRAHRSGSPSKIEGDPELEAFIVARIETLTYAEVVASVRANFPLDRHISSSGLQRWFRRRESAKVTIAKYQT